MRKLNVLLLGFAMASGGLSSLDALGAKPVPYSSPIAISGGFDEGWTVIDANNDGMTWKSYSMSATSIGGTDYSAQAYGGNADHPKDDWLISPAIYLEEGKEYRVFYGIKAEGSSHPQDLDVYLTTSNEPETIKSTDPLREYKSYKETTYKKEDIVFECTESGDYYLSFYCTSPNDNWYMYVAVAEIFENAFTPAGVSNLKAERDPLRELKVNLSWTLPTKSVFGDLFTEEQKVEKVTIYRDGATVPIATLTTGDDGVAATTFEDNESLGLTSGIHTYQVEVTVAGVNSSRVSATTKYVGPIQPATVPFTWLIDSEDSFADWTSLIGESSENEGIWTYYTYGPYARFTNIDGKKEENYFVAPPFNIETPGYYLVTAEASIGNTSYTDNILQIRYGKECNIQSLQNIACEKIVFPTSSKTSYSYVVKIDEPGTYYFAAVAASENPRSTTFSMYSMGLKPTEKTPSAVSDLSYTPGADYALEVTLDWTCPSTSSNGEELSADEYTIEVRRNSVLIATLDGGTSTYTDSEVPDQGIYIYSVKTVAAGGASVGEVSLTTKWVGPHLVPLPYSTVFSSYDNTVNIWDYMDANEDGKTWHYYSGSYRCAQGTEAGETEGTWKYDDYLLSPWFDMQPGFYEMTYKPLGGSATSPMTHNVGVVKVGEFNGELNDLQQIKQFASTTTSSYYASEVSYTFKIEEAGLYQIVYAAVGEQPAVSNNDSYYYYGVYDVKVAAFPLLPGVATELSAEAAPDQQLEAYFSWKNPSETNVPGEQLVITKAVVLRDSEEIATITEDLVPGETYTFTDTQDLGLTPGPHTYSVEIYNADGKSKDNAPSVKLSWVGGALDITEEGTFPSFKEFWTFVDVHNNQTSSYDGWSFYSASHMKVDETNSERLYDDWAVSPPFNFLHDYGYKLAVESYLSYSYRDYDPYTLDLYVGSGNNLDKYVKIGEVVTTIPEGGTSSDAVTTQLYLKGNRKLTLDDVQAEDVMSLEEAIEYLNLPAEGLQFALRATQRGGVVVKSFRITQIEAPEIIPVPDVVSDLEAVADDNGVTLTWTNPSNVDQIDKAVIIRNGEEIAEIEDIVAGETASYTDNDNLYGYNFYSVEVYNESGKSEDEAPVVMTDWIGDALEAPVADSSLEDWAFFNRSEENWNLSPRINIHDDTYYEVSFETSIGEDADDYSYDIYVGKSADMDTYKKIGTVSVADASQPSEFILYVYGLNGLTLDDLETAGLADEGTDDSSAILDIVNLPVGGLSFALKFHNEGTTLTSFSVKENVDLGVDGMLSDGDGETLIYTLQGIRVKNPEKGIYIVVKDGKITKQVIR